MCTQNARELFWIKLLDTGKQYTLVNSGDPDEMPLEGGISSGSASFAKIENNNRGQKGIII